MKASALRVTGSVASIASSLILFGGVASAHSLHGYDGEHNHPNNFYAKLNLCDSTVDNTTTSTVINSNTQTATSGNVYVSGNRNVGDVSSGDASNTNKTSTAISVANDTSGACGSESQAPTPTPTPAPTPAPAPGPSGGMGGESSAPSSTPVYTSTSITPQAAPSGGMGAGSEQVAAAPTAEVSQVPAGGVGAGTGGTSYLAGLMGITVASGALALARSKRLIQALMGHLG